MFKKLREAVSRWWGSNYTFDHLSTQVIDDESYGWQSLAREYKSGTQKYLLDNLDDIRSISRFLYRFNPHYRGLIDTYLKYVFGKPYVLEHENKKLNEVWAGWKSRVNWRQFMKELGRRFYRDGEVFIWLPQWRFINPDLVRNPPDKNQESDIHYGIEEDPDDPIKPIAYWIKQGNAFIRVSEDEMLHIADKDQDEWRGITKFLACMTNARNFEKWLGDRILLNRIRASIAIIREHTGQGGPSSVGTFADAKKTTSQNDKTTSYGATYRQKFFEPGSVIDAKNLKYHFLEPSLNAADVQHDGRQILLAIAASRGLPEYLVTGDSSNSNLASHFVSESAAIKEFDADIEFFGEVIIKIWRQVMLQDGIQGVVDPILSLPNLVVRDKLKETQRREIMFQNGIISAREWRGEEGYDPNTKDTGFSDLQ